MDILFDKERSEAVWRRVMGDSTTIPPESFDDNEQLQKLMDGEQRRADCYSELARLSGRLGKTLFMKLSCEELRHLRQLQKEYFILSGDIYIPNKSAVSVKSFSGSLRECFLDTQKAEADYKTAAAAGRQRVSALYARLAKEEGRNARLIEEQLDKIIG